MRQYEKELHNYILKQKQYEQDIKNLNSPDFVFQHRRKKLSEYFSSLPKPANIPNFYYKDQKNFIEAHIRKRFSNVIVTEKCVIIIDDNEQLVELEIRIDIPYDAVTGNPISYTNSVSDYFSSSDRITIFFAEEQIALQRQECIQFIEYVLKKTKQLEEINKSKTALNLVKAWTKDAAIKMAFKRFRSTYWRTIDLSEYEAQRTFFNNFKDETTYDDLPF